MRQDFLIYYTACCPIENVCYGGMPNAEIGQKIVNGPLTLESVQCIAFSFAMYLSQDEAL